MILNKERKRYDLIKINQLLDFFNYEVVAISKENSSKAVYIIYKQIN